MADVIVYGFPQSTYVRTVRLALEEKSVGYDLTPVEPGSEELLKLHPFGKIPAFRHGDLRLYETSAITRYVDETFDGPRLQPRHPQARARMNQWISAINDYYYADLIRVLVIERLVHPMRGQATDEARIQEAAPRLKTALDTVERALAHGDDYIVGNELTLADLFLAPILFYVRMTPEGQDLLKNCPALERWYERIGARATFAATEPVFAESDAA